MNGVHVSGCECCSTWEGYIRQVAAECDLPDLGVNAIGGLKEQIMNKARRGDASMMNLMERSAFLGAFLNGTGCGLYVGQGSHCGETDTIHCQPCKKGLRARALFEDL